MNHISLFSGIGGFDLASEWMGWNNVASCEINPFCRKVLSYYWPDALHHDNVHTFTKKLLNEKSKNWDSKDVILTGGFPCQPYSTAGLRKGKEDKRHLWPEMLRIIQEVRPNWIVGENVRGLVDWNGGLVFDEVQLDLEINGYEVIPVIIPACGKDAPHRRERIWFVAHSNEQRKGRDGGTNKETARTLRGGTPSDVFGTSCGVGTITDSELNANKNDRERKGRMDGEILEKTKREKETNKSNGRHKRDKFPIGGFENFPTQSPILGGNDGIPAELDGVTFPKWRTESTQAFGNAVVPQVVFEIFKAIEKYNTKHKQNENQ